MGICSSKHDISADDFYCPCQQRRRRAEQCASANNNKSHNLFASSPLQGKLTPFCPSDSSEARRQTKFPGPYVDDFDSDYEHDDDDSLLKKSMPCNVEYAKNSYPADSRTRFEISSYAHNCFTLIEKTIQQRLSPEKSYANTPTHCTASLQKKRGQYHWNLEFYGRSGQLLAVDFDPYHENMADEWEDKARHNKLHNILRHSSSSSGPGLFD